MKLNLNVVWVIGMSLTLLAVSLPTISYYLYGDEEKPEPLAAQECEPCRQLSDQVIDWVEMLCEEEIAPACSPSTVPVGQSLDETYEHIE